MSPPETFLRSNIPPTSQRTTPPNERLRQRQRPTATVPPVALSDASQSSLFARLATYPIWTQSQVLPPNWRLFGSLGSGREVDAERRVSLSLLHFLIAIPPPGAVSDRSTIRRSTFNTRGKKQSPTRPPVANASALYQAWPTTSVTGCRLHGNSSHLRSIHNSTASRTTTSVMPPFPTSSVLLPLRGDPRP